jgi:arylsulfatase A-like enzyme/Flp pilus assembly protein TadD
MSRRQTTEGPARGGRLGRLVSLLLALTALLAAVVIGCVTTLRREQPAPRPRHVLLITIDTLRADALGASGNQSARTPWLDRLAAGGIHFSKARAHNVVTLPSHANILTGRLPPDHGIRDNAGFRLNATEESAATRLAGNGFRTGAFISAFPLDSRFGLGRGFEVYDDAFVDVMPRPAFLEQERPGVETVAAASRWLSAPGVDQPGKARQPTFAWIHLYEPHFPYTPPEPYRSTFAADPYAGEVAAADAALGPVLQPILEQGRDADTLVVVTSDHGEALGDHGESTHGIFAYESTLKVPLILYYPPLLTSRIVDAPVSHVDILPTILDAVGLPAPSGLRGRSLLPLATASGEARTFTYFEALSGSLNRGWAPLAGVVADGQKYIDLPIPELYDLQADPVEARNLAGARPEAVARLQALLRSVGPLDARRADETSEVRERLRSLGYVTSTGGKESKRYTDADDPKRLIQVEAALQEIVRLYLDGQVGDAVSRARALTARHRDNRLALMQLAHLERETGNMAEAIAALRQALTMDPGDAEAASLLGATLTAANRPREAVALLRPYAAAPAADVQVLVALALAEARMRAFPEALGVLEKALVQDRSNAMILVTKGTVELMAGRRAQARAAFESALAMSPTNARAHSSLGTLAAEEGRLEESLQHWRRAGAIDQSEFEKLLAIGLSLARSGRRAEARAHLELFADAAPPERYAADIAKARSWLDAEGR